MNADRGPRGIEKLIQDAQKEGKFDDLEHKGQPLRVAFGDLASVANDVMRDNGIVPEWIELSRQIEALRQRQTELVEGLERRRGADRAELEVAIRRLTADDRPPTNAQQPAGRRRWSVVGRLWSPAPHARRDRPSVEPAAVVERIEQDRRRTLFQLAELVRDERKKVDRYNLVLAVSGRQMRRVRVEERLQAFQERFPALALSGSAGAWEIHERVEPVELSLLVDTEETSPTRPKRSEDQVQALRAMQRKPPPIG